MQWHTVEAQVVTGYPGSHGSAEDLMLAQSTVFVPRQAALSKQGLPETGATLISAAVIAPNCTTAPNYTAVQTGKACPKPAAHTGRPKSYYVQLGCALLPCVSALHVGMKIPARAQDESACHTGRCRRGCFQTTHRRVIAG